MIRITNYKYFVYLPCKWKIIPEILYLKFCNILSTMQDGPTNRNSWTPLYTCISFEISKLAACIWNERAKRRRRRPADGPGQACRHNRYNYEEKYREDGRMSEDIPAFALSSDRAHLRAENGPAAHAVLSTQWDRVCRSVKTLVGGICAYTSYSPAKILPPDAASYCAWPGPISANFGWNRFAGDLSTVASARLVKCNLPGLRAESFFLPFYDASATVLRDRDTLHASLARVCRLWRAPCSKASKYRAGQRGTFEG